MRINEDTMRSYGMHVSPWQQSHALMREYTTVLHIHRSDLSSVLGPGYTDPVGRGATVNASKNKTISVI